MSEFTNYYIVKTNDLDKITLTLEQANIAAEIVDPEITNDWWVVLTRSAELETLGCLFPICGHLFIDEDKKSWKLSFALSGLVITHAELRDEKKLFSSYDRQLIAEVLGIHSESLEWALTQEIWELLDTLGLPAIEMLDQYIMDIEPGVVRPDRPRPTSQMQTQATQNQQGHLSKYTYEQASESVRKKLKRIKSPPGRFSPYFTDGNQVYCTLNDNSGPFYLVRDADTSSFVHLDGYYGKDKKRVYWEGKAIPEAQADQFVTDGFYAKDEIIVFYEGKIVPEADAGTMDWSLPFYAKDNRYVFYQGVIVEGVDLATFMVFNDCSGYARDKNHIYFQINIVPGADLESFKPSSTTYGFGKDRLHRYAYGSQAE